MNGSSSIARKTGPIVSTQIVLLSALTHFLLGVWRFLKRRTLRIRPNEWVQLAFGLLIPLLLLRHVIGTRIAHEAYGINDNYFYALWTMWPAEATRQATLMLLVWVHGSIGLHHWLMFKPWYQRTRWLWNGFAVLIPAPNPTCAVSPHFRNSFASCRESNQGLERPKVSVLECSDDHGC